MKERSAGVNYELLKDHIENFKSLEAFLSEIGETGKIYSWSGGVTLPGLENIKRRLAAQAYEEALK